ncbi:MAG: hypothetical protein ACH34U_08650, partial [Cyanobium sp.]
MRARDFFSQAQLRLQAAGCRYRIKRVGRSPYVQVYETHPPRRQQSARGYRIEDEEACWSLVEVLLRADELALAGSAGLDWEELASCDPLGLQGPQALSWGELRALVCSWIAPGGPKARDRNPFVCFRDGGYFGRAFADDEAATTRQLEEFCLFTPESLLAYREDPKQQLIRREYNSRGFYGVVQMVNYLGHEVWHIDRLPGEVAADPGVIEVGSFQSQGDGSETKTGHRFALPLPEAWLARYRLNDLEHARSMLAELRRRHPIKTAERADGSVQFFNNSDLAIVLAHWLRNRGREDREITVKFFGYHQPRQLPGKPKPKAKRERCKLYDLRHAWALRAKATTTWSTAVKAASMGHSEAVHASRYLVEEQAEHKLAHLLQRKALDEGRSASPMETVPVIR